MSPNCIPREDDACDVISKAMRGLTISPKQLAQQTGLDEALINASLKGKHDDSTLKKIAPALHLSASALVGLAHYNPDVTPPDGLLCFVTPFGHAGVNAYAIITDHHALVFDTGTDASPIIETLTKQGITLDTLYITHRHHDHTAGIPNFGKSRVVYPEDANPGDVRAMANGHQLTTIDASGHLDPARAYLYEGLEVPICILGDSIFAGSMGGAANHQSYQQALQTARENLMTLPTNTIFCPGHGPLTTVAHEQINNPFLKHPT